MKRLLIQLGFLAAFGMLASVTEAANGAITFFGIGDLKVGMAPAQLRHAGFHYSQIAPADEKCYEAQLKKNKRLFVMLEDGRVTRVSTTDPRFRTLAGIRVGSTESQVKRTYGKQMEVRPHKYDERGHYLILKSDTGEYAIVMETDGLKVTNIHAGLEGSAQYVEGCS